jgi:hypothetical protein
MSREHVKILGLAVSGLLAAVTVGLAQPDDQTAPRRAARPRIHIQAAPSGPEPRFYRECTDGYRQVWRPYWHETVIMPYMSCHWVRG